MSAPTIRALVTCYNDWAPLADALASLAQSRIPVMRVSVLDNGSDTPPPELSAPPLAIDVETIRPNRGYAGGMNHLLARALADQDAELLLLMNADARLEPDTLERLCARLAADPQIGGISPRILQMGTPKNWFAGGYIQVHKARCSHLMEPRGPGLDTAGNFVTGCVFLVRRAVLEAIGTFHEGYFMYLEDSDMCLRIHQAGWKLAVDNDALAHHHVSKGTSRSAASSDLKHYFIARNRIHFAARHLPSLAGRLYFWAFYLLDLTRDGYRDWRAGRRRDVRLRLEGMLDGLRGVTGAPVGERLDGLRKLAAG